MPIRLFPYDMRISKYQDTKAKDVVQQETSRTDDESHDEDPGSEGWLTEPYGSEYQGAQTAYMPREVWLTYNVLKSSASSIHAAPLNTTFTTQQRQQSISRYHYQLFATISAIYSMRVDLHRTPARCQFVLSARSSQPLVGMSVRKGRSSMFRSLSPHKEPLGK